MRYLGTGKVYFSNNYDVLHICNNGNYKEILLKCPEQNIEKIKGESIMSKDEMKLSLIWNELSQTMKTKISELICEVGNKDRPSDNPMYAYQTYAFMEALSGAAFESTKIVNSIKSKEDKLKMAAEPLVKLLQSDYDPHTTVLVENDHVTLMIDEIGVPFEVKRLG